MTTRFSRAPKARRCRESNIALDCERHQSTVLEATGVLGQATSTFVGSQADFAPNAGLVLEDADAHEPALGYHRTIQVGLVPRLDTLKTARVQGWACG